jgi:hypothetical protein
MSRLVPIPDQGYPIVHYPHKIEVAMRALNLTRQFVFGDDSISTKRPVLNKAFVVGSLHIKVSVENAEGLFLYRPKYSHM